MQTDARRMAIRVFGTVLVGAVPWSLPSVAADGSAAVDSAPGALDEVVVTARRRNERLDDVPVSDTVQSGAALLERNAVLIEDVASQAPNVLAFRSARSVSALEVTIRGQTAIPSSIVYDPAVGLYVDGVYVANGQGAMGTLLDIDQVEIVRGAQGTLAGRNNTGGSILLTTKRPALDAYAEEFAVSLGADHLFEDRVILNAPLASTVGVRFAYQGDEHAGWGSSIATGQSDFMNEHREQWRIGALWQPSAAISAYVTFERFEANEAGALLHPLPNTLAAQLPGDAVPTNLYQTDVGTPSSDIAHTNALQLTVSAQFAPSVSGKLILGYRELRDTNDYDPAAAALPIADVTLASTSYQKSAELQLGGHSPHDVLDWVGGVYAFRDNGSADSALAPSLLNPSAPVPTLEQNAVQNTSLAAYAHAIWALTPAWHVAGGVRHTSDGRELTDNAYLDLAPAQPAQFCTILTDPVNAVPLGAVTGGPCPLIHRSVSYDYYSWEAATDVRVARGLLLYARSGRAQRSGGWNVPFNTLEDQPFKPEQLTDVELGAKSSTDDGRASVQAAVFSGQYDNMQRLLARVLGGTPTTEVINAGSARVEGVELESTLRLSRALSVHASAGYTDAHYTQFIDPFGIDESHNQFYMTPKYQAALSTQYEVPLAWGSVRLGADYAWHDRVQFNVIQDPAYPATQGAYGVLGARLSVLLDHDALELALFGTNLLDKGYAYVGGSLITVPGQQPVASWEAPGDRRLVGVQGIWRLRAAR